MLVKSIMKKDSFFVARRAHPLLHPVQPLERCARGYFSCIEMLDILFIFNLKSNIDLVDL